jgi:hypothetical protein
MSTLIVREIAVLRSRIIKPLLLIAFIAACGKLADVTGPRATGLKVRANRATSSVVDPASTPAGLRACWGAEGNAVDSVSAHVGAVSGGVTYGPGRYGQAFWFQNGDADITIANDSVLNVGSGSGMTMTAWIKTLGPEWNGVPGAGPILEYQGGAHLWSHVQYVDPTGALFANLIDSSTYNWNIVQINNLLPANEWVHVAVTYDKVTGQEILYGNGVEIKRETRGAFTPRTWQTLHIGSRVSSDVLGDGKFAFNGLIDDASIYDRALTADEMAGLYLSTESKCKPAPVALAVSQQPAGVESGATMATQPQITLKDLWNNPVTSATNPVTVSLIAGNGVLSGTTTVNAVNGVASFSDLAITGKGVVTLKFTSPGLTAATAGPTVTQVVRQIVVTRQAGGGVSGFPFSTQPVAELRDAGGLLVTTATTAVTATLTNGTGSLVGATTVNAVGGIASFTNLQVNGIGSQTVTFSATGVVPANNGSTTLNVIPGPDAALAVIAQPTSAESGVPFATQPVIEVRDATGARTASTIAITAEIASGPGTLSGRTTVNAVNGRATFTDLTIAGASAGTTLRFSALSLPPVVSAGFPIVQVVRVLAVVANPSATVVSGFALAQQPVVELRDAAGIRMSAATNPVTAAINSGPGTLSGTTMVTPVNGLATFTDLTLSGAGSSTLQFTTPGANTLVSSAIAVTVAPPTQLGITQQPTAVEAGAFFSPVITVDIRDALGGRVAGAVNPVTVSIATGTGTLLGTTTVNAVNGTATFTDLKVSGSGNVTLAFAAAGLTGATSASFAVTPVVRQLVLTTPPSGAISGFALTSQPVVELRDLAGNKVVGATNAVAVAVSSGTPVLSGTTTVNAVNGVATFTNLLLTGTGTSTLSFTVSGATTANSTFNVTAAPAVALGMVTQPSAVESGGAFSTPISVEVRDGLGARVAGGSTPVTATITSGTGQLLGATTVAAVNGLATFSTLKVGGSGSFVLTFSSAGLTTAVSNSFAVTQVVRSLVMVQAPAAAASGIVLGQQPAFQLRDSADIQVAGATNAVSVAVTAGTGVLSGGATTVNAVNGAAQFSGLILTGAGNSTLTFTSGTLTPVSAVVNVTTVAASQLAIQTQPAVLESGALLSTQPVIAVKDLLGNVVAGATPLVTASIASGTATLSGTTSVNAVNGIATFTDLKISGSGPVTLQFSSPALTGATSTSLNVVQNIRGIQIAQTASGAVNGFNFTQQPVIRTVDAGGTLVTAAGPYPVEVYSMTAGATLSGTQAVYAVNGLATFSNLRLTAATVPSVVTLEYRLIGGGTIQQTIIVQAATATQLALTTAPAGFESGVPFTTQPIVQVRDANGNAVATNVAVTATITSGNGTLGGTTTVNATNGVAAFTNLKIAGSGAQTITFSSPGLVSAVSAALNVVQVARAVALTTPPSGAVSGFPLTSQPVASIVDAAGLVVPGAVGQVTATLASGNATLSGTTTVTAVNGIATFTNLALNGSGSATLTFSYTGTTSATSPSITITPAPASQVAITTQPTAVESGVRFTPTIVAEVRDGNGQRVSTATNAVTVTVASGTGTLNGSTTVQAVNGIATFTDLEVAGWGSHQLAFSAVGLSQAVSNAFTVTQVVRNAAVTLQPSGSESGVALAVQPVVELRDSAGLRVVSASQSVTAAVASGTAALSGTVTINAYQGTANFSNLTLSGAGATTLSFASAGVNPAPLSTSLLVTQIPHALSLSTAPAGAVSGLPFTTQPTVTVLDAAGLQVLGGTTVVNVAVQSGPGILSGTTGVAAVNGVVSFSNLRLSGIGTSTLVFSGPGLTTTTATIEVIAPPASGMGLLTQPGGAESGVNLTSQPVVEIRDTFGNRITTANNAITVAVASGSATLTGTTTVTAVNGVATFSDLKLSGSSSVTLSFTATGLSPVTSNLFTVTQQVRQVALIQQPGQAYTNQAFLTQPIVELRDAAGLRATFYNGQLTASVVTGNGTIIGNQLETAVNGVVTFSSLGINGLGSFVLNFKVGNPLATNTANVNSIAFNVTTPPATQLNVVTEPSGAESGVPFTTQPVVELLDQFNTRVTNTSTAVTASIASGPGTLLGTTTVTSNNGLASFSNLKIAGASSGTVLRFAATGLSDELSQPIAVTQVVRSMVATTAPGGAASGALLAPQPTIELRDAAGLIVTSANAPVTASISSGSGTLQGTTTMSALNGVIVYYDLAITGFGANTLTFTYGGSPAISAISTPAVNITAGAPAALAVNAQPTTVESGAAMTAPIAIEVRDAAGNRNTTVSVPVSVSIFSGTGTLTGTTTVSSVNGIATFTNLAIGTAGTPVVLQFTSGALTPVNSASIAVNQVLRQMVVTTPPSGGASGAVFGTQPAIELRDAAGIKLASGSASVTAAIATGTGTLNGTTTVTSVNGVATFTNLSITGSGAYTLRFTSGSVTVNSASFNVTNTAPAKLAIVTQPTATESGVPFGTPVAVEVRDASGIKVANNTSPVTVSFFSGTGVLIGTTTVAAVNGTATFTGLAVGSASGTVTLAFSSTGLTGANSNAFAVTQVLRQAALTTQPSGGTSGTAFTTQPVVELRDAAGLKIATATGTVTASISSGTGTLVGSSTATATAGVATYSGLGITGTGSYALTFTIGTISVTSNAITVTSAAPSQLAITQQPTTIESGAAITPALTVAIKDATGNVVTSSSAAVTVSFNTGTGVLTNATVNAVNGIATFSNLTVGSASGTVKLQVSSGTLAGATTNSITVNQVVRSLALVATPTTATTGTPMAPQPVVELRDAAGLRVVSGTGAVTATVASGLGTLGGTTSVNAVAGQAAFTNLSITGTGMFTLAFNYTNLSVMTSVVTGSITVIGTPSRLVLVGGPTTVESGVTTTPAFTIEVRDANGNRVTSGTTAVTVGLYSSSGVLLGTTTVSSVNGVATFTDLKIGSAAGSVRLQFTSGTLTAAITNAITVTQVVRQMAVVTQPAGAVAGKVFTVQPVIEFRDAAGIKVATATNSVTAALASGSGTLGGTLTVSGVAGTARYTNLQLSAIGAATLSFSSAGLPTVNSASFTVASALTFYGFFDPIEMGRVSVVQAGRVIPFKYAVTGVSSGTDVVLSVTSAQEACVAPTKDDHGWRGNGKDWNDGKKSWKDDEDKDDRDGHGHYDPRSGQRHFNWTTDKAWAGTCRVFTMTLIDGSTHVVHFRFKKGDRDDDDNDARSWWGSDWKSRYGQILRDWAKNWGRDRDSDWGLGWDR